MREDFGEMDDRGRNKAELEADEVFLNVGLWQSEELGELLEEKEFGRGWFHWRKEEERERLQAGEIQSLK
jgi:hypothetical protein